MLKPPPSPFLCAGLLVERSRDALSLCFATFSLLRSQKAGGVMLSLARAPNGEQQGSSCFLPPYFFKSPRVAYFSRKSWHQIIYCFSTNTLQCRIRGNHRGRLERCSVVRARGGGGSGKRRWRGWQSARGDRLLQKLEVRTKQRAPIT